MGVAHDRKIHNLFQITDVNSCVIRWIKADLVTLILPQGMGLRTDDSHRCEQAYFRSWKNGSSQMKANCMRIYFARIGLGN
ncbi:DUF3104 domain-containing protein [Synechococcus sp. MIT S9504]|uniref:DUF3104 domain-containing protein n=1 Tax=unclassified Synechococcus TaxID=2626047 RepID=UPI000AD09466|nr:DUF3104 domain-containing protein [Synechococcus sp. MIT S9504]